MTAKSYPYAQGDLLSKPNTYFYAEYGGREFIDAWKAVRAKLAGKAVDPPNGRDERAALTGDRVETDLLLDHMYTAIRNDLMREPEIFRWLAQLVKKFEVTKRIHRAYGPGFRAVDPQDHQDAPRYLRLAEVFDAAYGAGGDLPFLNALLKVMDTLSTLADQLNENEKARLARLVGNEKRHVTEFAERLRLSL